MCVTAASWHSPLPDSSIHFRRSAGLSKRALHRALQILLNCTKSVAREAPALRPPGGMPSILDTLCTRPSQRQPCFAQHRIWCLLLLYIVAAQTCPTSQPLQIPSLNFNVGLKELVVTHIQQEISLSGTAPATSQQIRSRQYYYRDNIGQYYYREGSRC